MSVLLPGPQLVQKLVMKVAGRDRSLLHEKEMKRLCGKTIAKNVRSFLAQSEDLLFAQPVSDRLGRPLRVTEDGPLGTITTGPLGVAKAAVAARSGQEVTYLREEIDGIVVGY